MSKTVNLYDLSRKERGAILAKALLKKSMACLESRPANRLL